MTYNSLISQEEVGKRLSVLNTVSKNTLNLLGPEFTQTSNGHIQTDIATVSSIAGLIVLQETVNNLDEIIMESGPGNFLLSEVYEGQNLVFNFMTTYAASNRLDPKGGWGDKVLDKHRPLMSCQEMTRKLAPYFYKFCIEENLDQDYWKVCAAMIAMNIVIAGQKVGLLGPNVGKSIAAYYVVVGSKTIPFKEALWP